MRALRVLTVSEARVLLRDPAAVLFTVALPLLVLFVFGEAFGDIPDVEDGRGTVDLSLPGYLGMIAATVAFLGIPIAVAGYREQGVLVRFRASGVHPLALLGAQSLVHLALTLVGAGTMLAVAWVRYGPAPPLQALGLLVAYPLAAVALQALGFALGGLLPSARAAQAVGTALFFPMLFLSGGAFPREMLADGVRQVGELLPVAFVIDLLTGLWTGAGWDLGATVVLTGLAVAGTAVAVRTVR